ncbi:hypothetical protein AAG570_007277 [Ranatra chinensis]|uniref:Origin recognition complex subunit 6 n=1 Tax=Ranatra chinensis TaxID=642074 RepID=A0ABD0XVE5_9HEMI
MACRPTNRSSTRPAFEGGISGTRGDHKAASIPAGGLWTGSGRKGHAFFYSWDIGANVPLEARLPYDLRGSVPGKIMGSRVLNALAGKLGVDPGGPVVRKAEELRRLVSLKTNTSSGLSHLNETCIAVICLDLAARSLGAPFNTASGVKLSCVTKPNYTRALHTLERLLGMGGASTPHEIAAKAGAPDLAPLAARILQTYKSEGDKCEDFSHPMYACAAVKAASKLSKTPTAREALVESCRVKAVQLDRLSARMQEVYSARCPHDGPPNRPKKRRGVALAHAVTETASDGFDPVKAVPERLDDGLASVGRCRDDGAEVAETIEDWKKRILGS